MKTYRMIIGTLIFVGIPTILTYLAYKASAVACSSAGDLSIQIVTAGITYIIVTIVVALTIGEETSHYMEE